MSQLRAASFELGASWLLEARSSKLELAFPYTPAMITALETVAARRSFFSSR